MEEDCDRMEIECGEEMNDYESDCDEAEEEREKVLLAYIHYI